MAWHVTCPRIDRGFNHHLALSFTRKGSNSHILLRATIASPYRCRTISPQGYVYLRNARFFETDEETGDKLFDKGTGEKATAGSGVTGQKVRAPPVDVPGLSLVAGPALTAPDEGALAVIFFFATWCTNCKRCLPAILALAERYKQEGGAHKQGKARIRGGGGGRGDRPPLPGMSSSTPL